MSAEANLKDARRELIEFIYAANMNQPADEEDE